MILHKCGIKRTKPRTGLKDTQNRRVVAREVRGEGG